MIVADLAELQLYPVVDRGVPNSERIPILVCEHTNMGQFGVMVGVSNQGVFANPIKDNLLWFEDGFVKPGDWILVCTGSGTPQRFDWSTPPGSTVYVVHWGRQKTMFANSQIVPVLFKVGAVQIDQPPEDLPQISMGRFNQ